MNGPDHALTSLSCEPCLITRATQTWSLTVEWSNPLRLGLRRLRSQVVTATVGAFPLIASCAATIPCAPCRRVVSSIDSNCTPSLSFSTGAANSERGSRPHMTRNNGTPHRWRYAIPNTHQQRPLNRRKHHDSLARQLTLSVENGERRTDDAFLHHQLHTTALLHAAFATSEL